MTHSQAQHELTCQDGKTGGTHLMEAIEHLFAARQRELAATSIAAPDATPQIVAHATAVTYGLTS